MFALLLLICGLAPGTWLRAELPPPIRELHLRFVPLRLPAPAERERMRGPFTLEAVWRMTSRHSGFGGFSALLPLPDGDLLAISDKGMRLRFTPPDRRAAAAPEIGPVLPGPSWNWPRYDAEAAAIDAEGKTIWIAWETSNEITRHGRGFGTPAAVSPAAMAQWGSNSGPEAMARLAEGRFLVLREGFSGWWGKRRHAGLRFSGDPVASAKPEPFVFAGPAGFRPTDMAPLPDGRVLILLRKLTWPIPARFAGRIAVADPRDIRRGGLWRARVAAKLEEPLPVDNFEGLAVVPREDGRVTVWLISDDNGAVFQRTLLWKLTVDPVRLPARGDAAADSPDSRAVEPG